MTLEDAGNKLYESLKSNAAIQGSSTSNGLITIYLKKGDIKPQIPSTYEGYLVKSKTIKEFVAL